MDRGNHAKTIILKEKDKKTRFRLKPMPVLLLLVILYVVIITINKHYKMENNGETLAAFSEKEPITSKSSFPDEVFGVKVHNNIIEENTQGRPGTKRKIKYIVLHETDNKDYGATAESHAVFLKYNNETTTSWHYTVDDSEIYHHLPDNEVGWHAGDTEGNTYGIGIELCTNKDGDFERTFANGAKLIAYLLLEYNLNIDAIKTHKDFSGKECPKNIIKNERLQEFKNEVEKILVQNKLKFMKVENKTQL